MSLSDEAYKKVSRHLMRRVALDKNVMTYRLLSRECAISVQHAKRAIEKWCVEGGVKDRGVRLVWCLVSTARDLVKDDDGDESMNGPSSSAPVTRKTFKLVLDDGDSDRCDSKFAYAAIPSPQTPLTSLTNCSLPSIPAAERAKWPAYEGAWSIKHPQGERRKAKAKAVEKKPERVATLAKPSTSNGKGGAESTSKGGKADKSTTKDKAGSSSKASRPMGQLGGLFADRNKAKDKDKDKDKKVPSKRSNSESSVEPPPAKKATATKAKKVQNGLFQDEVSDDDDDDDDDDAMQIDEVPPAKSKTKQESAVKENKKSAAAVKDETDDLLAMFDDEANDEIDAMMAQVEAKKNKAAATKSVPPPPPRTGSSNGSKGKPAPPAGGKKAGDGTLKSFFKK